MSFQKALDFVLEPSIEGGYVNDKTDRGGATNHGVTQRVYDAYRAAAKLRPQGVEHIDAKEVNGVYFTMFWLPARCDLLPPPLDVIQFDSAVQHGPQRAVFFLQRALCVAVDGNVGPATLAALARAFLPGLIDAYILERSRYYQAIIAGDSSQRKYENGWNNRLALLRQETAAA